MLVGIIAFALILFSSFAGHKMSIIGTKVLTNLVEEITEEDDTWEIVNMSESEEDTGENEEQIASVSESNDDEASAVSNEDSTYSSDEGVSAVASTTLDVEYSDITNVGASTINITDIDWTNPDYYELSDNLNFLYVEDVSASFIYWDCNSLAGGETLTGDITLLYESIGFDAEGESINMYITIECESFNNGSSSVTLNDGTYYTPPIFLGQSHKATDYAIGLCFNTQMLSTTSPMTYQGKSRYYRSVLHS